MSFRPKRGSCRITPCCCRQLRSSAASCRSPVCHAVGGCLPLRTQRVGWSTSFSCSNHIEAWVPFGGVTWTSPDLYIHHSFLSVCLTGSRRHAAIQINRNILVQESCEQRVRRTSTIPSSSCFLQKAAVLLPSALGIGCSCRNHVNISCGLCRPYLRPHVACSTLVFCCPRG